MKKSVVNTLTHTYSTVFVYIGLYIYIFLFSKTQNKDEMTLYAMILFLNKHVAYLAH